MDQGNNALFCNRFVSSSRLLGVPWFPFLLVMPHTSGVRGNDGCRGPVLIWPSRLGVVPFHGWVKRSCRRVWGAGQDVEQLKKSLIRSRRFIRRKGE